MVYKTISASIDDAEEISALMLSVSTSPRLNLEFAKCRIEDRQEWITNGIRSELAACEACGEDATALKVVVTLPGEKEVIVGFAIWVWSDKAYTSINSAREANPLPGGINLALRQTFSSRMTKMESDHRPKGPCFVLGQLAASLSHQRRGIGAGLVQLGLNKAEREGMACYLSGAPMGVPLYRQLGFEEVGRLEIPLRDFGGSGTHVHVAMIRRANANRLRSSGNGSEDSARRAQADGAERNCGLVPLQY